MRNAEWCNARWALLPFSIHNPNSALFIKFLPVLILALTPWCVVVGIADDGGDDGGAFGIDHLLQLLAHLAPTAGLEEGRRRAGTVAHVGNGDLDSILMHGNLFAKDLGADDGVLCEVLGGAAADHEEAALGAVHLDFGELEELQQMVYAEGTTVIPAIVSYAYHNADWKAREYKNWQKLFQK